MTYKEILRIMFRDYFVICTGIIICQTIFCLIITPDAVFTLAEFGYILFGGVIFTIPHFVFCSNRELDKNAWKKRRILHLAILICTILSCAHLFGWLNGFNLLEHVIMIAGIFIVYMVVWTVDWSVDNADSRKINQKLKEFNGEDGD
ncbi:MAG: DUF3021 domain-containing protein [Lachnospiraceae bacterium]|nr:DUF3021 domain-containing protein [Lachnospiraceae bacterium]